MIRTDISQSHKIAGLSPEATALFCLIIPHLSSHGKLNGEPHFVKGLVCPLISWLTVEKIEACLKEIDAHTNLKWFEDNGLKYLHAIHWKEHQDLRDERLGADHLPSYPGLENSRTIPGRLPLEVEGEVKEEVKKRSKNNSAPMACPSLDEVKEFFITNHFDPLQAEDFYDFYESNGWKVSGRTPMKNWHASARRWNRNSYKFGARRDVQPEIKKRRYATAEDIIAKRTLENGGTAKT